MNKNLSHQKESVNYYFCLDTIFILHYPNLTMANNTELTKISFGFTSDDMKILNKLKGQLEPTNGTLTHVAVIRIALRALIRAK
jgi:hypothetical protein